MFSSMKDIELFEDTIHGIGFTKQGPVTRISNLPPKFNFSFQWFAENLMQKLIRLHHFHM